MMDDVTNYSYLGSQVHRGGLLRALGNYSVFDVDLPSHSEEGTTSTNYCPVLFRFVWYTVITGTLCLLGITGNTLSILILQRDKGNEVANLLLQALAFADNALLFTSIILLSVVWGSLPYFNASQAFTTLTPIFLKYIQPLGYMAKTCAIWMTVLLAINRYIVIKRPLEAQWICTLWKARLQVIAVLVFSVVCNVPRFFQFRILHSNSSSVPYEATEMGKGSLFNILYTNVLYTLLVLILPLIILVFMNVSLILELKHMKQQRSLMNISSQPSDTNITLVMCIIIVIFIVCHTPDRILQGVNSFYKDDWWKYTCYLSAICNLLIIINSSTNFLVYYFLRKRFRRLLFQVLCPSRSKGLAEGTSQTEDETELNGPLAALRKLSRSMTEILFRQVDTADSNEANGQRNARANSLGNVLNVNQQTKTRRSQSAAMLLDVPRGNTGR